MKSFVRVAGAVSCALMLAACVADSTASVGGGYYGNGGETYADAGGGGLFGDGAASAQPILAKIDPNASMMQSPGQGVGVFTQYDSGGHWYVWWTCDTSLSNEACDFAIRVTADHGGIANARTQGFTGADKLTGSALVGSNLSSSEGSGSLGSSSGLVSSSASEASGSSGSGLESSASVASAASSGGSSSRPVNGVAPLLARITASTTTTTTVQGVHFDTDPGAIITLSAALGGEYSGSFLFFVQDGKVNGGYTGVVSDPLELQSSSP